MDIYIYNIFIIYIYIYIHYYPDKFWVKFPFHVLVPSVAKNHRSVVGPIFMVLELPDIEMNLPRLRHKFYHCLYSYGHLSVIGTHKPHL